MTLQLPLDIQQLVDDQLASGEFANAHDVLREALRLLRGPGALFKRGEPLALMPFGFLR